MIRRPPRSTQSRSSAASDVYKRQLEIILLNVMVALLFIMQNAGTNYLATVAFASVNRGIEGSLRNAMVRKLQQLSIMSVSYTHLRAHETRHDLVCRLLLEKKKKRIPYSA